MKKYFISTTLIFMLFSLFSNSLVGQTFEIRIIENETGYLAVQMRETSGTGTPTTSIPINDISFEIRWLTSLNTDIAVICSNNDYYLGDALGALQTNGSYSFRLFQVTETTPPFYPPHDWTTNQWETLATFKATSGTGSGEFQIAPHQFGGYDLNWNQGDPPADYLPTINGSATGYSYPTLIYTYVWKGGGTGPGASPTHWNQTNNWENECGNATSTGYWPYQTTENVYIPNTGSGGYYPETWNTSQSYAFICGNLRIANGAHITVPDLTGNTNEYFNIGGNLIINDGGKLYLPALGYATVTGSTEIKGTAGIEVQADATGVGSFIDNGTITYGSNGSGKVQTYLVNSAAAGSFHIHLIGPTVDEENYTGSGTGAFLSAFDVSPGNTYAYEWDESQPVLDGWQNISSTTAEIHTGTGIALSTVDATTYTLNMTGEFITGNTTTDALTFSNNHNELVSNPYPSAIDFDAFATDGDNSGVISNKNWLWDPSAGNYLARSTGTGGQQYIQVGQAFFVETISGGNLTFKNSFRVHSADPFRDVNPNELTLHVSGGNNGYADQLAIRFVEDATYGYDPPLDAYKMYSMYEDATQIESVAEDGSKLSVNFLPLDGLQGDMVSVPVNFQCGYSGDYAFDFEGIETFENNIEIWLEDKKNINDSWIYLNNNPHYTFSAVPYEPHDRFVLHFFGPTSVDEKSVNKPVDIFSYRQFAYVKKNEPNETIKTVSVYNLNGEELFTKKLLDQPVNKLWVSDQVGYYLVKVVTDKNIYIGKIFIFK